MAEPMTTQDLQGVVVEILPSVVDSESIFSKVGASSVDYNTDIVRRIRTSGANVVAEGGQKSETPRKIDDVDVVRLKVVYEWTETEEFQATEEGNKLAFDALQKNVAELVKSADIYLLTGKNPADGTTSTAATGKNIYDLATKHDIPTTSTPEDQEEGIIKGFELTPNADAAILSRKGLNVLQFSRGTNGPNYPGVTKDGVFDIYGVPCLFDDRVGIDGWTTTGNISNETLTYVGDFKNIARAYNDVSLRMSKEATIAGVNLFEHNMVGYVLEMWFSYYIENGETFTVVQLED